MKKELLTKPDEKAAAVAGKFAERPAAVIEQAACVAYECVRGLGLSRGESDIATWQTVAGSVKAGYRLAVKRALAMPGPCDGEELHRAYVSQSLRDGWSYGAEWNGATRTNPLLRDWMELTDAQRFAYGLMMVVARQFECRSEVVK